MHPIALSYLDTAPSVPTGITWGVPLPRGMLARDAAVHLRREDGTALATQQWPLAWWPDGSVKWLGLAAVLAPGDGARFSLTAGAGPAPARALTVVQPGIELLRRVDTGAMVCEVGDRGRYLIQQITHHGRTAAGGLELVCWLEQRSGDALNQRRDRERHAGIVEQLTVEQAGPIRAVLRLDGRHRGERSGRRWLPFTVRLVLYAGCDAVQLVHSVVFDGDPRRDFIAGLGVSLHVPLVDGVHNRLVRVVGEGGSAADGSLNGAWTDPVRLLPYAGHDLTAAHAAQLRGEAVAAGGDSGLLPAWSDHQLLQDSADHAVLRKRQDGDVCWVDADHARRPPGIIGVSEPAGGMALGLRDFWQAFPTAVEVRGAAGTQTRLDAWWWAPDAQPMDLRHYGERDHRPVYEAVNPDPAVYSSALGIARTSELLLWPQGPGSTAAELVRRRDQVQRPPLLVATPAHYHACRVFGPWSPADRSTSARAAIEDEIDAGLDFVLAQVEERRWYGFWNHGDVMWGYDAQRRAWQYDIGGKAWQNTELAADVWPWFVWLRSGRADAFRFAAAMTRHVSEVDAFHLGPWTGQGSRHNVVHWGCPCKEPRVSQAGAKRFLHYLTADERCRDLLDEVAEQADRFKATNVPTGDPYVARIGPTWAAWAANWLCAWERSGDERWKRRILAGIAGILAAPLRLLDGSEFAYDPATGALTRVPGAPDLGNRLVASMGGAQVWMELAELLDHPGFADALAEYGAAYAATRAELAAWPAGVQRSVSLRYPMAHLMAWAGNHRGSDALRRRAWEVLRHGDGFGIHADRLNRPVVVSAEAPGLSAEPRHGFNAGTNQISTWSLAAMACLDLVGPPPG